MVGPWLGVGRRNHSLDKRGRVGTGQYSTEGGGNDCLGGVGGLPSSGARAG